jgi:hypothetical protein
MVLIENNPNKRLANVRTKKTSGPFPFPKFTEWLLKAIIEGITAITRLM